MFNFIIFSTLSIIGGLLFPLFFLFSSHSINTHINWEGSGGCNQFRSALVNSRKNQPTNKQKRRFFLRYSPVLCNLFIRFFFVVCVCFCLISTQTERSISISRRHSCPTRSRQTFASFPRMYLENKIDLLAYLMPSVYHLAILFCFSRDVVVCLWCFLILSNKTKRKTKSLLHSFPSHFSRRKEIDSITFRQSSLDLFCLVLNL